MKYLITLVLILAIIVGLNFMVVSFIDHSAHNMLDDLQQVRYAATSQNTQQAATTVADLRSRWEHDEPFWEAFTDHREVEQVDILINRLEGYIDERTTADMTVDLQELEYLLRMMTEKHQFRLENIL